LGSQRFELARCERCGTAVSVGLSPPGLHDSGAYGAASPRLHALAEHVLRLCDRQRLAMLRSLSSPPARLLDVGAGRGRFVAAAREAGYEAEGVEPSERGLLAARA